MFQRTWLQSLNNHVSDPEGGTIKALEKAKLICSAALDKKAADIVILDMRALSNLADYFVICSASSARRVQTIADNIEEALFKKAVKRLHVEGKREALWVLIDYGDVIAHIFYEKIRNFYDLERLWRDAPKEHFSAPCTSVKSKKS